MSTLGAQMQEPKLYPAGRLIWLTRDHTSSSSKVQSVEAERSTFERIIFSRRMASDHLIPQYEEALRDLLSTARRG
eukprot:CAMPEP_0184293438 /NCGR_PEP_ID=MMETSP1049-20130417/4859_1 /TAXON_ID=77928 /ORGANISM="Proteomonas sulcata, Strain CCMP704" /LENGTH=75 /DNA_ID=CAMNT_0026601411 /DNA_START=66 /DNA_END=293 /DNA_ORIENTATION=+